MVNWKQKTLGEISEYSRSRMNTKDLTLENYISTTNLLPGKAGKIQATSIPSGTAVKYSKGQTLFSNIRPYFKKIWQADNDGGCSSDVLVFKITENIDDDYFYYYLSQDAFFDYVMAGSKGTKMPRGDKQQILKFPFNYPNIEEQKAIAATLSCLDDKIELNNRMNQTLEEMAQALFKSWFVDFEFPNENGEPYKFNSGKMVNTETGMIPEGWEIVELSKIVKNNTNTIKPFLRKSCTFEHYSIPAYDSNRYPSFDLGNNIKSNKYKVYSNSMLVSKLNPNTKRVWLPLNITENTICSTEFLNFTPIVENTKYFCFSVLNSKTFSDFIISNATGSTNSRQRVKPSVALTYKIPIPQNNLAFEFNTKIEKMYKKIKNNIIENQKLKELRNTLLPKLMSGEIRVPIPEVN